MRAHPPGRTRVNRVAAAVLRGSAHADQRTVQAAETVPRGSDQLAGGSGIGVIRDDPGGGARRGVLAEALRGGGGR